MGTYVLVQLLVGTIDRPLVYEIWPAGSVPRYLTFVATSTKTLLVFEASLIKLMDVYVRLMLCYVAY